MKPLNPGSTGGVKPLLRTGGKSASSASQPASKARRQIPRSDTHSSDGPSLTTRETTTVEPLTPGPGTTPEEFQLYTPPHTIPRTPTSQQQHLAAAFKKGIKTTLATKVRGTQALKFLPPIDVIRTPQKGNLATTPQNQKIKAGYDNYTDRGHQIHSSTLNLDEPIAVTCQNVNIADIIKKLKTPIEQHETNYWIQEQLTPSAPVPSTAPSGQFLQQTQQLTRDSEASLQRSSQIHESTAELQDQLTKAKEAAIQLQRSASELTTTAAQLKAQAHKTLTTTAVRTAQLQQRIQQPPPENPQAAARTQTHLTSLEQTLSQLHKENQELQISQKQLHDTLLSRQAETQHLLQQLKEIKAAKENIESTCNTLKKDDIAQRSQIQVLQREKLHLEHQIVQLKEQLLRATSELEQAALDLREIQKKNKTLQQGISLHLQEDKGLGKDSQELSRQLFQTKSQLRVSLESSTQTTEKLSATEARLTEVLAQAKHYRTQLQVSEQAAGQIKEYLEATERESSKLKHDMSSLETEQKVWNAQKKEITEQLRIAQEQTDESMQLSEYSFAAAEQITKESDRLSQELIKVKSTLSATEQTVRKQSYRLDTAHKTNKSLNNQLNDVITQFDEVHTRLSADKKRLRTELKALKKRNDALACAISQQAREPSSQDAKHSELEAATYHLIANHSLLSQTLFKEQKLHSETQHTLGKCQRTLSAQSTELALERKQLVQSQLGITDLHSQLNQSQQQCQATELALKEVQNNLALQKKAERIESQKYTVLSQGLMTQAAENVKQSREIEQLKQRLKEAENASQSLSKTNAALGTQLTQERSTNSKQQTEIAKLKQQLAESAKESQEAEKTINSLESSVTISHQNIRESANVLKAREESMQELRNELSAAQEQLATSKVTTSQQSAGITNLKEQWQVQGKLAQTNSELMTLLTKSENTREQLAQDLESTKARFNQLISEKKESHSNLQALNETLTTQSEKIENLTAQATQLQAQLKTDTSTSEHEKQTLQAELHRTQAQLKSDIDMKYHFQKEVASHNQAIKQQEEKLTLLHEGMAKTKSELVKTSALNDQKTQQIKALQQELAAAIRKHQSAELTLGEQQQLRATQETALKQANEKVQTLSSRTTTLSRELSQAQENQKTLNAKMLEEHQQFENELITLQQSLAQSKTGRTAAEQECIALKLTTDSLNQQNAKLSKTLSLEKLVSAKKVTYIAALEKKAEDISQQLKSKSALAKKLQLDSDQTIRDWTKLQDDLITLTKSIPQGELPEDTFQTGENLGDIFNTDAEASLKLPRSAHIDGSTIKAELQILSKEWHRIIASRAAFEQENDSLRSELENLNNQLQERQIQAEELRKRARNSDFKAELSTSTLDKTTPQLWKTEQVLKETQTSLKETLHRSKLIDKNLEHTARKLEQTSQELENKTRQLNLYQDEFGSLTPYTNPGPKGWVKKRGLSGERFIPESIHEKQIQALTKTLRSSEYDYKESISKLDDEASKVATERDNLQTELHRRTALLEELANTIEYSQVEMEAMQQVMREASEHESMEILVELVESLKNALPDESNDLIAMKKKLATINITQTPPDRAAALGRAKDILDTIMYAAAGISEHQQTESGIVSEAPLSSTYQKEQLKGLEKPSSFDSAFGSEEHFQAQGEGGFILPTPTLIKI